MLFELLTLLSIPVCLFSGIVMLLVVTIIKAIGLILSLLVYWKLFVGIAISLKVLNAFYSSILLYVKSRKQAKDEVTRSKKHCFPFQQTKNDKGKDNREMKQSMY